ncbi:MAG: hypothetical protein ACYSUT_03780 [Planctomycetota bacterium]
MQFGLFCWTIDVSNQTDFVQDGFGTLLREFIDIHGIELLIYYWATNIDSVNFYLSRGQEKRMLKTFLIIVMFVFGFFLLVFAVSLDYKGKKAIGIPGDCVVIESEGNYYWASKRERPMKTTPERMISQREYDTYLSYTIKMKMCALGGVALMFSAVGIYFFSNTKTPCNKCA